MCSQWSPSSCRSLRRCSGSFSDTSQTVRFIEAESAVVDSPNAALAIGYTLFFLELIVSWGLFATFVLHTNG